MPTPQFNAADLTDVLINAMQKHIQMLLLGPPGCGKSAVMEHAAELAGFDIITMYPALIEAPDAKGYLTLDADGQPHFRPAGELWQAMHATKPTVLFLDELGQASESVQKACMSLVWARRVGEQKMPDHIVIMGASNRNTDLGCGSSKLNPALLTRFHDCVELVADAQTWAKVATLRRLDQLFIHFVTTNPDLLKAPMPVGQANTYERWTNARTLTLACEVIAANFAEAHLPRLLQGCIGEGPALAYCNMRKIVKHMPTFAEVCADPEGAKLPASLSEHKIVAGVLAQKTCADTLEGVVRYIKRLPSEAQPSFWAILPTYQPKLKDHEAYRAYLEEAAAY